MRLERKGAPEAADRTLTESAAAGHRARGPVRGVGWTFFQRQREHSLDCGIADLARRARARLVRQPLQTARPEAGGPFAPRGFCQVHLLRYLRVRFPLRAGQDDPCPQGQGLSRTRTPHPALQRLALLPAQQQRRNRSPQRHEHLPCTLDAGEPKLIQLTYDSGHEGAMRYVSAESYSPDEIIPR